MKRTERTIVSSILSLAFILFSCAGPVPDVSRSVEPTEVSAPTLTPKPTEENDAETEPAEGFTKPDESPIYLSIIWHQHQPVYFKDPNTGIYTRPWVRVHATKDYVDMASILREYPDIHATFNLTPSLIRQLDDFSSGAKDLYWVYAEIPADDLTDEQKGFILDRFFDTNQKIISRFPRYEELLLKRDSSENAQVEFSTQDIRDLQVLFNLAWVDPDWLTLEPLATLVEKGGDFTEEDKQALFEEHLRLIEEVIPVHRELQDAGQIEVTMTPFAHPILPLLVTTDLAQEALPNIELPPEKFVYGQDAQAHVTLGVQLYEDHFGRPPRGMWPAEGSVAQEIVSMVSQNGIRWMASDEGVLANSLGFEGFTRNSSEVVVDADQLYRPYYVQGTRGEPVAMVFRDVVISDKVGFTYSGLQGSIAAADFIGRVHAIRDQLMNLDVEGPFLVSVILDGENAWEYYDNDGKEFLHSLYQQLSEDPLIITVTPSEFLEIAPDQPLLEDLWAGSWISHDFSTWIGEEEENMAWGYLKLTRDFLQKYITGSRKGNVSGEVLQDAVTQMYIAEGSDWFWWYGSDQNSGNDESFDAQYRNTLKGIYTILGEEPPSYLDIPIIPQRASEVDRPASGLLTPTIDGVVSEDEWEAGGRYKVSGGAMASSQRFFDALQFGFDAENLYLAGLIRPEFVFPKGISSLSFYIKAPGGGNAENFSSGRSPLGFPANRKIEIGFTNREQPAGAIYTVSGDGTWVLETDLDSFAIGEQSLELAIPLALLGNADTGDLISIKGFYSETFGDPENLTDVDSAPSGGPGIVTVPDLGTTTVVLDVADPEGDDYGPGTYTYPLDGVFRSGAYDLLNFQVGYDEENIVFRLSLRGPVENVWDSPNGLSIQTFDIYLDRDSDGQGGVAMLPGRNLSFQEGFAWDIAIHAEGWTSAIYAPGTEGPEQIASNSEFSILADPGQRKITMRVPKSILGDAPERWGYAAVLLSQEGFPSGGVMRVRDVLPVAEQWRIGGGPAGTTNHTRVLDFVWPIEGEQERWLSDFSPTDRSQADLTQDDFARVPMLVLQ